MRSIGSHQGRWSILFPRGSTLVTHSLIGWPARVLPRGRLQGADHRTAIRPAELPGAALLNRRIEVLVRAQFGVPQDYNVALGPRKPSNIGGYDSLPVTLSRATKAPWSISSSPPTTANLPD